MKNDLVKNKIYGILAAIRTLGEMFPTLNTNVSGMSDIKTVVEMILFILRYFGVPIDEVLAFISKLLTGDEIIKRKVTEAAEGLEEDVNNSESLKQVSDGILASIEIAVKGILIANLKSLFDGCPINPIIPDNLMESVEKKSIGGKGIEINLDAVDTFGILRNFPLDDKSKCLYFDAAPTIYDKSVSYRPNELWKSCDFNAFLWYVINKGDLFTSESRKKNSWDNRVSKVKEHIGDEQKRHDFFDVNSDDKQVDRKRYLMCEYVESNGPFASNLLKVWINADRYKFCDKNKNFCVNSSIFQFNYDYVMSLKLFESKTLVATIINDVIGLGPDLMNSLSLDIQLMRDKVKKMVETVIENDGYEETEQKCSYTFSNEDYDKSLREYELRKNGLYNTFNEENSLVQLDYDKIIDGIENINNFDTIQEGVENALGTLMTVVTEQDEYSLSQKFAYGESLIKKLIESIVTEIVMNLMTPKVAILFDINSQILGNLFSDVDLDIFNGESWKNTAIQQYNKFKDWKTFFQSFENMIFTIIREVSRVIIEQLFIFMMQKIKYYFNLYIKSLILEKLTDYRDLIMQMMECYMKISGMIKSNRTNLDIDDVNYADIIPIQIKPKDFDC